ARARAAAKLEAYLFLTCSTLSGSRFGRQRPGGAQHGGRRARGLCSTLCSSAASHAPLPLLSAGEISCPAGDCPAASAAGLALAGQSSRDGGGPFHRWRLLLSVASRASLYPHHPLLRRWRCGKGREQRRRSTSGVDLMVAEQRTSCDADLSGGGLLRRPPPQPPAARPAKSGGDSEDSASIKRATDVSRGDIVVFRSLMNHHELVIAPPGGWIQVPEK
ncbi:unnamed protein product, partial [Urochloa humidicola]